MRSRLLLLPLMILLAAMAPATRPAANDADDDVGPKSAPAAPSAPIQLPPGVRLEQDVSYLGEARKDKADLYFPADSGRGKKLPAVIVIHGGGFNDGDKAKRREVNISTNLAAQGFVAMSINYKLAKTKGLATFPQPVLDAKTAVRYLRANAEALGIDPDRIGVIGGSAGGNLSSMLALTRPEDGFEPTQPYPGVSSAVKCAVNFYGAVDLMNYHDMKMFARTREEAPELYRKGSPVFYAHAGAPPMLIVHGTADTVVDVSQSHTLAAALKKVGAPYELLIIDGAPHTFDLQPKQMDLRPVVLGFFDKHLRDGKAKFEFPAAPARAPATAPAAR